MSLTNIKKEPEILEIKDEPIDDERKEELEKVMEIVLNLCQENPNGVTEKTLQIAMQCPTNVRAEAINKLLNCEKIDIMMQGQQLLYRIKDPDKPKAADNEERIILGIIEKAGNKGIWNREIRFQSNMPQTTLNKVLKNMESRKVVKTVKSVAVGKKKVYMLYNLEPDVSVTGGAWYNEQDFEAEFVDALNQFCYKFLQEKLNSANSVKNPIVRRNQCRATSEEVWKYIKDSGISKVELKVEDIESILSTLVSDGRAEMHVILSGLGNEKGNIRVYSATNPVVSDTGLMKMPCGVCPVRNDCTIGGQICPTKCIYLQEWLAS